MIRLTCSSRELSRLIHAKRVRIDPSFRGELIRLFDNPKARMAYFSKHGLSVDELGEAIWDAGLCFERPTCDDVLETLESLFTPGVVRQAAGKRESAGILADVVDGFERELEVRRKNRWRSFKCACFNSAKIRATKDELPAALRAINAANEELLRKYSVKPHHTAALPKLQWKKRTHTPWEAEYDLVGADDQRIYAGITDDHGIWSVWHNGAGFGEYTDEQAAKLKAESVAKELGDKTWAVEP